MIRNQQKLEDRIQEIFDLKKERDEIDVKLAKLTGIEMPNDNSAPKTLPHGLTLKDEIVRVFEDKGDKMRVLVVKAAVDRLHQVNIPRRNIQATMQYMMKRDILQKKEKEYGVYSLKTLTANATN